MIGCCEQMWGYAASLLPHIHSGMSAINAWAAAAAAALQICLGITLPCLFILSFLAFGCICPIRHNFQHWMSWLG